MKRALLAVLVGVLLAPVPAQAHAGPLNVVASFPQDGAIAKAVGGSHVEVTSLAKASKDPHAIQPKPSMAVALNRADLLITNGQEMELAWLPIALANARNARILEGGPGYFDPSVGVNLLPYTRDELADTPFFGLSMITGAQKAAGGTVNVRYGNHHYWLDPANGIVVAHNVANKLAELDPPNAATYRANAARFEADLRPRMARWDAAMAPFKGTPVVSYHRDWIYLIDRHHLKLEGYVEPRETIPPSAGEVAKLVRHMGEAHVKLVLTSPWQNQRIAGEVARLANAHNLVLPSSVGEDVGVRDYVDLFTVIYGKLIPALKAARG